MDADVAAVRAVWPEAEAYAPCPDTSCMIRVPDGLGLWICVGDGRTDDEAWHSAAHQAGLELLRRSHHQGALLGVRRLPPPAQKEDHNG